MKNCNIKDSFDIQEELEVLMAELKMAYLNKGILKNTLLKNAELRYLEIVRRIEEDDI